MKYSHYMIIAIILVSIIFAIDVQIPLGVAFGVNYIIVILFALKTPYTSIVIYTSILCTAMVLLGLEYSPEGGEPWKVYFNRLISILAIWLVAFIGLHYKKIEAKLMHLANHDLLTGLYNRGLLEQRLDDEIRRASRYKHNLSLFMIDIDHFKNINDTYGHQTGDIVLRDFAKLIEKSIRYSDYAARYGGEEFVIILPETSFKDAMELADRLRKQISKKLFITKSNKNINITVSIGVASYPEHALSRKDLIGTADSALYEAKKSGRNLVIGFGNAALKSEFNRQITL